MGSKKKEISLTCPELDFHEEQFLFESIEHIAATYGEHYSGGIQVTDFIMSHATSLDWLTANAVKYIMRYGKKDGYNKKDLLKAVHYIALMNYFSQQLIEKERKNGKSIV